MYMWLFIDPV